MLQNTIKIRQRQIHFSNGCSELQLVSKVSTIISVSIIYCQVITCQWYIIHCWGKRNRTYNSSWICYAWLYPIQCGLFTDINPLMAILMNIKDSIIVTIMYISPHDKPCPRKCGKLLPKKGKKEKSLQNAGFESINWWMYGLIIR